MTTVVCREHNGLLCVWWDITPNSFSRLEQSSKRAALHSPLS